MGVLSKLKRVTAAIVTGGGSEAASASGVSTDDVKDAALFVSTGGLSKPLQDKMDSNKAKEAAKNAAAAAIQSDQQKLRELELEQAQGNQAEASQLAQRAIIREQQSLASSQQRAQASIANQAAQSGFKSSSALQGLSGSVASQVALQSSDLADDSARVSEGLESNLAFLQETFDLGGNIGAASQQLADIQQSQQEDAQQLSGLLGSAAAGGSIAGPVGAGVGAGLFVLNELLG